MKKILIGGLTILFLLGAGNFAFAQTNENNRGFLDFEEMKPQIEKMHPNWTDEEQREMFNTCHGSNGGMQNQGYHMMNNF